MPYRARESHISKDPEKRAQQLANLLRGRKGVPTLKTKLVTAAATLPNPGVWLTPVWSAEHLLGIRLWSKQKAILEAIRDNPLLAGRSANACGKTFALAVAALLWLMSSSGT
jgi:hypothetical protein